MTEHNEPKSLKVWDPLVRIGHWGLVAGVLTAYFTGDEMQSIHVTAGYVIVGIVLFRLIWGFVGTKHARFSDFVRGPGAVLAYLKSILSGGSKRFVGHNPAGGAMILALLFSLSVTTGSGLMLFALEEGKGPLAPLVASAETAPDTAGPLAVHEASYDEDDDDDGHDRGSHGGENALEDMMEGLHKAFTYLTLGLAGLHVIGVVMSGRAHKENLVAAMITGRKKTEN